MGATSSASLTASWEAPELDDMDGELTSFSISCDLGTHETEPNGIVPLNQLSFIQSDLQPYTTYTCCVNAQTTVGVSGTVCQTQTTLEDGKFNC